MKAEEPLSFQFSLNISGMKNDVSVGTLFKCWPLGSAAPGATLHGLSGVSSRITFGLCWSPYTDSSCEEVHVSEVKHPIALL